MELLSPPDYSAVMSLLPDDECDLAVPAIIAGHASGRVYADDPDHPRVALLSPHWGRLYLLGRPGHAPAAALRGLIDKAIRPAALAAGALMFTVAYEPGWKAHIPEILGPLKATPAERQCYRWAGHPIKSHALPHGFTLTPVVPELMARADIANLSLLAEEMVSERASLDDFLARSFGIVALAGDQLAGWCLSEYNSNGRCEVGIASLEPFQRRGLATAMGSAFLEMARSNGIREVGWHCWKQNVPSAAAARKIGLEFVTDYWVHFGWYNESGAPL